MNVRVLAHEAAAVAYSPLVLTMLQTTLEALVAAGPDGISSAMFTTNDVVVSTLLNASGLTESVPNGRWRLTESTRRRLKPTREARPC